MFQLHIWSDSRAGTPQLHLFPIILSTVFRSPDKTCSELARGKETFLVRDVLFAALRRSPKAFPELARGKEIFLVRDVLFAALKKV